MPSHRVTAIRAANRFCALSALLLLLAACETSISAIHQPLYRATAHNSTIEATATNSDVGIQEITITVTTGEMIQCAVPSAIPCRQNATTITHVCNYTGAPSTATCTYTQALGNQRMVSYSARAVPVSGSSASTQEITYAAGFPPTTFIARPVWWHRDADRATKIDLGWFPDADYLGAYTSFTDDMEVIAEGTFFNDTDQFAQDYTVFRELFNLWAAPFGADAEGCTRSFDPALAPLIAEFDGEAIVHDTFFRDCASIALGGAGSISAGLANSSEIFVHESGHFLQGLGDEYCCDGGYATAGSCANVFGSQASCQAAAPGHSADPADCMQIGTTGFWRNDNGNPEIMANASTNSDWEDDSGYCVSQRFANCILGSCY